MESKHTIIYLLNEEGQRKALLAGGDGRIEQRLPVDSSDPIWSRFVALARIGHQGAATLDLSRVPTDVKFVPREWVEPRWDEEGTPHLFSSPQTAEALVTWEEARRERIAARKAELQPTFDAALAEYVARHEEARREKAERDARELAAREEREAREAAEKERLAAEKATWIEECGSRYLRDAHKLGYPCQRVYVNERAAMEFPEFAVDFGNNAAWKERACPSPEALEAVKALIAQGIRAEVVWLTAPPYERDEDDYCDDYDAREAIAIRKYLGKYDLVKEV